jgi:ABC-type cobalamin/Fe3+-siderophores transport system ATPase subunit
MPTFYGGRFAIMPSMSLAARSIRAGYDQRLILDGVDLTLRPGQLMCLLGPNGAGKSTLVRCLCGLIELHSGSLQIHEQAISMLSPASRAQKIGFLPQEINPSFNFRVDQAVALGARVAGHGHWFQKQAGPETVAAVDRALALVDALHLRDRELDALSGGERRRVLLASVLAQEPQFLLLDEPTAMLDLEHQVTLFEALAELTQSGLGVLVVTHDLNLAARWADEIVLLRDGRVAAQGNAAEVLTRPNLEAVFGPRFELLQAKDGSPAVVPR